MKQEEINVLVGCEESQAVCIEFRKLGFNAFSCDLQECSGGHPEWHLQQDVTELLKQKWDMIVAFPPCTYLTVTGNRWFNIDRYGEKAVQRHKDREEAIKFFLMFANAECDYIAIENPVGIMSSEWRKPDQIINPYEFGDPYEKKTCLWLKGLPPLKPTNVVRPEPRKEFKSGKTMPGWYADAWKLPKDERAKLRSKTFPGIAQAMVSQWTSFITEQLGRHDR
jgi:site-specific DNA-cytosine methylase